MRLNKGRRVELARGNWGPECSQPAPSPASASVHGGFVPSALLLSESGARATNLPVTGEASSLSWRERNPGAGPFMGSTHVPCLPRVSSRWPITLALGFQCHEDSPHLNPEPSPTGGRKAETEVAGPGRGHRTGSLSRLHPGDLSSGFSLNTESGGGLSQNFSKNNAPPAPPQDIGATFRSSLRVSRLPASTGERHRSPNWLFHTFTETAGV